ncbi:uncharacterized protein [Epargyreus clarus]|uniref:uncharacterized protein isoform X2 n=1 Tax=Epargyreus clarus TaxID=520877 RepID=UPI003C2F4715
MAPIRYSLHYEDYSEHLMSRFGKLLQMQSLVDMTLMCSSHTLRVHKAVLAASSAYFQEVLQKQAGEPLIILKMRFSVLKSLVEFMYCGKTQCLEENLDELVSAAQFLKIKGLSKVTKEGLGITNQSELPVFTPPVVINRPPQSLIDLHSQDNDPKPPPVPIAPPNTNPTADSLGRTNKDMVVRIPFDIENGTSGTSSVDYADNMRSIRPRRGRPSRAGGWDGSSALGRAAERALLRREQDSRKAIHQLKHLQTRHMQDYMDRVTLSQAVNSICDPDSSSNHNYMNVESDLMYMDQSVNSSGLDPNIPFPKDHTIANETITSNYTHPTTSTSETNPGIGTAMSQYVNALKSAGLPTDLPILFESGDGSYINVNEQVLLDMVQSSEIQYEVIEQPNIIEKVADPSEIKSIDELSKSIERGEMLISSKSFPCVSDSSFSKDNIQCNSHEDPINSLNAILPDNLESFSDQQNYVVLGNSLQDNHNPIDHGNTTDFSCIDNDMQFFTKSMSDDVKKYYEDQQLNDARVMEQLCPTSSSLDTSFNMSLLDTKDSHLNDNITQQYTSLNTEDFRLPDSFDCLMSTSKPTAEKNTYENDNDLNKQVHDQDEIMKDLLNIEKKINMAEDESDILDESNARDLEARIEYGTNSLNSVYQTDNSELNKKNDISKPNDDFTSSMMSEEMQWDTMINKEVHRNDNDEHNLARTQDFTDPMPSHAGFSDPVGALHSIDSQQWDDNKENGNPTNDLMQIQSSSDDIPYAVGLLPLKQVRSNEDEGTFKRKDSTDASPLDDLDAKCLKRKVKYKKLS